MAYQTYNERVNEILKTWTHIDNIPSNYNAWDCEKTFIGITDKKEIVSPITPKNIHKCIGFREV